MKRSKISIIGVGRVGENVAYLSAVLGLGDLYLFGRHKEGLEPAKAKALDLKQMSFLMGRDIQVVGISYDIEGFEALWDSSVVIITAGIPRRSGMSREELLRENINILKRFTEAIRRFAPDSVVIVVSNPVDILTYATLKLTGFDHKRVIGMAGILDSARFKTYVREFIDVSFQDIRALVMGTHGDLMVPVMSHSFIGSKSLEEVLGAKEIDRVIEATRQGGGRIVRLMGTSAYYAPAASVVLMLDAILGDRNRVLPCSAYLKGEVAEHYETEDICIGIPVVLGREGIKDYELVNLSGYEKREFLKSANSIRELTRIARSLISE